MPKYNLRKTVARAVHSKVHKHALIRKRKNNTWMGWVSPSSTRNFILNDLISDLLMRKKYSVNATSGKLGDKPTHFLLEQGNEFEKRVVQLIRAKFSSNEYVDIEGNKLPRSYVLADNTLKAMQSGVPIIFSPVFHDFDKKWNGVPDLLVRSDYIGKLFTNIPTPLTKSGCEWNPEWHYLVVDIKFSTLHLRSNGIEMLNEENYKAYKAQLWMYNDILARMQKFNPRKTFILGRNIKYSNAANGEFVGNGCFDQPGVIDYDGWDNHYDSKVKNAIRWLREVPKLSEKFHPSHIPTSKKWNLYPNLCVNNLWVQQQKHEIAEQLYDITMLPYCGVKQREAALKNGVVGWNDSMCSAKTLGFKPDSYRGRIVDACIEANHPNSIRSSSDVVVKNAECTHGPNYRYLKSLDAKLKVYIDFETISNVCDDFKELPRPSSLNLAFMATVGFMKGRKYVVKTYTARGLSPKFERRMFEEMINDVPLKNTVFVHWGSHDKTTWEQMEARTGVFAEPREWFDAHRAYENNAIGIRGCFKTSLKKVTNSLHELYPKHITQSYVGGEDGMEAMHQAYIAQQESEGEVFIEHPHIKKLKEYNVKDVIALREVTRFLESKV